MRNAAFGLLAMVMVAGCGTSKQEEPVRYVSEALTSMSGCADAEAAIRQAAIQEVDQVFDSYRDLVLSTTDEDCSMDDIEFSAASGTPTQSGNNNTGAQQYSTTNNQVAGVDEPDFLKNDARYLYVAVGSSFRIVDAWPPTTAHEIANVAVEGSAKKLFVAGDRAVVYSSLGGSKPYDPYGNYQPTECTYGYSCQFVGDGRPTLITVFDIKNRAAPKRVREIRLSGSMVTGRRIGNAVHTVLTSAGVQFPGLQMYLPVDACGMTKATWELLADIEEARARNHRIIETTPVSSWAPSARDTLFDGEVPGASVELLDQCNNFYRSGLNDGTALLTVLSFDLTGEQPASTATIVSRPGASYASADALYVAVPHQYNSQAGWLWEMRGEREASTIHKFTLSSEPARAAYAASGTVKGKVLNQFSMDEYEGHLRIATTKHMPLTNLVSVVKHKQNALERVGIVEGIAVGEDIRSARFQGDRGFVVTFKKTDPLFVLDLADPTSPRLLGELIIPGFSTYIHMMDPTHLLTVGYDGDDQGAFAWFSGISLQIFDVSNPHSPMRIHHESIGTRGSSSEALTNHLAFNFFAPIHMLALPMTVCEGGGSGMYGSNMTFSGLMVYDTTVDKGFVLKGKVAHPTSTTGTAYYDPQGCQSWWTQAASEVKRSVFMDNFVYSVSERRIKVNALEKLETDVNEIVF